MQSSKLFNSALGQNISSAFTVYVDSSLELENLWEILNMCNSVTCQYVRTYTLRLILTIPDSK